MQCIRVQGNYIELRGVMGRQSAAEDIGMLERPSLFTDHPPCSPDLNPCENFWGQMMARDVIENGTQIETVGALRQGLFTSWRNIPDNLVQTHLSNVPQRIFEIINKNRGGTYD